MSIEERLSNLEKLVNSLIKRIDNDKFYDSADKMGIRQTEGNLTSATTENDTAICDIADLSDVNSSAIDDLAVIIDELINKVYELEEKVNGK